MRSAVHWCVTLLMLVAVNAPTVGAADPPTGAVDLSKLIPDFKKFRLLTEDQPRLPLAGLLPQQFRMQLTAPPLGGGLLQAADTATDLKKYVVKPMGLDAKHLITEMPTRLPSFTPLRLESPLGPSDLHQKLTTPLPEKRGLGPHGGTRR